MKVTINLPPEAIKLADEGAKALCLSRSAFIAVAITEKMRTDTLLRSIPQLLDELKEIQDMCPDFGEQETKS